MRQHRFIALDALRGVAAFLVLFRHIHIDSDEADPFYSSFLAVDFFFLLSGFVLEPTFAKDNLNAPQYILKRVIRLWPTYLVGCFLTLLTPGIYVDNPNVLILGTVPQLFLLPNPLTSFPFPILSLSWSLFAEFWAANLAFALIYRQLSTKWIVFVVLLAGATFLLFSAIHGSLDIGFSRRWVIASVPRVIFSFGIGCLIRRFLSPDRLTLGVSSFIAVTAIFVVILSLPESVTSLPVQVIIVGIVMPLLLLVASRVSLDGMSGRVAEFLGVASYPAYALHPGLGSIFRMAWLGGLFPLPYATFVAGVLIFFMSWVFATFVDEPMRGALTRKLALRRTERALA